MPPLYLTEQQMNACCLRKQHDWCQEISVLNNLLAMWECALLCQLSHCNIRYGCASTTAWMFWAANHWLWECSRIQIWLLWEKEIKSFVMLSVLCPEGRTSSDIRREEGCQQVMQRLRREVFPELLYTTEVDPNKGCRSLRLIMKEADMGPEAALNCWLCVGCYCLLYSECGWEPIWRFTAVIHELACTLMDMWCIN